MQIVKSAPNYGIGYAVLNKITRGTARPSVRRGRKAVARMKGWPNSPAYLEVGGATHNFFPVKEG